MLDRRFLSYSADKLRQSEERIAICLERLTPDQIWWRGSPEQNAVGNLVLHLSGNVNQWLLTGVGGEPDTRDRDSEFAARGTASGLELRAVLQEAMVPAYSLLSQLQPERLHDRLQLQGYDLTVLEGIYHVVEHFSLHTGQILYITKMLRREDLGFYAHLANANHAEKVP